jgi:hypothetical protein
MRRLATVLAAAVAVVAASTAGGAGTPIPVSIYDHTGIRLTDVVWTGSRLLYMENTTNVLWAPGKPPTQFATMPRVVEETRCVPSPAAHGWPAGSLFCHSPDNVVYRVQADGAVNELARLNNPLISDGAVVFDRIGTFGYRLLVATGRSGAEQQGGTIYAVSANGAVARIGGYGSSRHGGAENMVQAPRGFGTVGGWLVLALDAGAKSGSVIAFGPKRQNRVLAYLPDGANPVVVVPAKPPTRRPAVPRGLYVTDTNSTNVFHVGEGALRRYAGDIVVGTEIGAQFWAVAPHGTGFTTRRIPLTLPGSNFNLEGAAFVG